MATVDGQVDKVVRIIATSTTSWADAARAAVAEAAITIRDLHEARVVERDMLLRGGELQYRIKLEMAFQVDRTRLDAAGHAVRVKRYLLVANRTLCGAALKDMVDERVQAGAAEFHVLVPQTPTPTLHADPTGMIDPSLQESVVRGRAIARRDAEDRLARFRSSFTGNTADLTGEIAVGDPVIAIRRVLERATFDEVIVSTLPPGLSKWLRLDLPKRIERACNVPVTSLIQREES